MSEPKKVRVVNENGHTVCNRLWDHGVDVMPFDGRTGGFVNRNEMLAGEKVVDGWLTQDEFDQDKREMYPQFYESM